MWVVIPQKKHIWQYLQKDCVSDILCILCLHTHTHIYVRHILPQNLALIKWSLSKFRSLLQKYIPWVWPHKQIQINVIWTNSEYNSHTWGCFSSHFEEDFPYYRLPSPPPFFRDIRPQTPSCCAVTSPVPNFKSQHLMPPAAWGTPAGDFSKMGTWKVCIQFPYCKDGDFPSLLERTTI